MKLLLLATILLFVSTTTKELSLPSKIFCATVLVKIGMRLRKKYLDWGSGSSKITRNETKPASADFVAIVPSESPPAASHGACESQPALQYRKLEKWMNTNKDHSRSPPGLTWH